MSLLITSVKLYMNSMKTFIKYAMATILLLVGASAFAQGQGNRQQGNDWMARMRSEKIAFLTSEIGLTPEEAQAFWPIYNKAEAESSAAFVKYVAQYKKILSAEKVAKLFVAEERFRNNQILRLQGGGGFNQNRSNGGTNGPGYGFPWGGGQNSGGQRQGTQRQGTQKQEGV